MSFNIDLWTFNKRANSTKRPTDTAVVVSGQLMDNCDVISPSIRINRGLTSNTHLSYNYAYIQEFNRYYWITSWTWEAPHWIMNCMVDVLGTYKTEIGQSTHYVLRAASNYDTSIPDTLYPATSTRTFTSEYVFAPWNQFTYSSTTSLSTGTFILGVSSTNATFGSIQYYALSYTDISTLVTNLMSAISTNQGFDLNDASMALQRSLVDPLQFIKSCVFIPLSLNTFISNGWVGSTQQPSLTIFDWTITANNYPLQKYAGQFNATFNSVPTHPQSSRGTWVNMEPYTYAELWAPPFGSIAIDTSILAGSSSLRCNIGLDLISGYGWMRLVANNTYWGKYTAQVGVPIQLTQIVRDYVGTATSAIGGIASLFTGNWLGAAASVGNAINSAKPRVSSIGGNGQFADLIGQYWYLYMEFYTLANDNLAEHGRPLCQLSQMNALSGYILCENASMTISGTANESEMVNDFLNGGFFYE